MIHLKSDDKKSALAELAEVIRDARAIAAEAGKEFHFELQKICKIANGFLAFADRVLYQEWAADKKFDRKKKRYTFTMAEKAPEDQTLTAMREGLTGENAPQG